jgi:phage gp46-like protein
MADLRIFHTANGGEVTWANGSPELADGLESSVYLSLFGGNEDDSGLEGDDARQWWGNLTETEPARRYRSETGHLLRAMPAVPANLRRVEDAAVRDLEWMVSELGASVSVRASIPALNQVLLQGAILIDGTKHPFDFLTKKT